MRSIKQFLNTLVVSGVGTEISVPTFTYHLDECKFHGAS
jgi:hypothetical protein